MSGPVGRRGTAPRRRRCSRHVLASAIPAFAAFILLSLLLGIGPAAARSYPPLFHTAEIASTNFGLQKGPVLNWTAMLRRWKGGAPCATPTCNSATWPQLVAQIKAAGDPMSQIKAVNSLINAHPYIEDMPNWGKEDYWATAYEFLKKNGDCEDFSITKYMLLKAAGFPVENMRVFAVRLRNLGGIGHAILIVYQGNTAWVLDNRNQYVLEASRVALEFQPVISINEQFWWLHLPK
jgi:predicted transglutaminase-like cysteine proteinase